MHAVIDGTADRLSGIQAGTAVPAVLVAFLGLFMIWGVGFLDVSAVHNAAHDVRHSAGFPCH